MLLFAVLVTIKKLLHCSACCPAYRALVALSICPQALPEPHRNANVFHIGAAAWFMFFIRHFWFASHTDHDTAPPGESLFRYWIISGFYAMKQDRKKSSDILLFDLALYHTAWYYWVSGTDDHFPTLRVNPMSRTLQWLATYGIGIGLAFAISDIAAGMIHASMHALLSR